VIGQEKLASYKELFWPITKSAAIYANDAHIQGARFTSLNSVIWRDTRKFKLGQIWAIRSRLKCRFKNSKILSTFGDIRKKTKILEISVYFFTNLFDKITENKRHFTIATFLLYKVTISNFSFDVSVFSYHHHLWFFLWAP